MRGIEVKKKLQENRYALKDIAELMGESPQNLQAMFKVEDIKTGVLERIAKAINKDILFFYDVENENNILKDTQLAIDITKNRKKVYNLYQRIVDIEILIEKQLGEKRVGGYAVDEAKILNSVIHDKMGWDVTEMTWEKNIQYNNQLLEVVETFSDIFFERFKILYNHMRGFK